MNIRLMTENDRAAVLLMMRTFYNSPAVATNGSEEIYNNDIDACVNSSSYAEGYVFAEGNEIQGYAMLAKSFSTEYGKMCIWIEDLYIKPQYRKRGIGREFFEYIGEKYSDCILRLEAEEDNETAVELYKKSGFSVVPYLEMWKIGE